MHLCFINMPLEYYSPVSGGAISTIIMQSARELLANGHEVSVLTITGEDETYDVGQVVPISIKKRDDLSFLQRRLSGMRQKLNQWDWPYFEYYLSSLKAKLPHLTSRPDVVIVFNDLVLPKYIKQILPETKVMVWLQNEWRTNQASMQQTIAATDKFLTCSTYIRDWTAQTHNIPLDKFAVVNSGVDLEAFYPRPDYLQPQKSLRTLFIGRIDPNKGPDLAADAVAQLQDEDLPVCLTVAGALWFYGSGDQMTDPFFRKLHGKMETVGAQYLGHVTRQNVPAMVREHDVAFVLSRSNEPFGLVILEAMASGCAVIASNRGGLPEACGDAALLVDPDDNKAIVDALRALATDSELLKTYKMKSIERAGRASWANQVRVLEDSLKETSA